MTVYFIWFVFNVLQAQIFCNFFKELNLTPQMQGRASKDGCRKLFVAESILQKTKI